MRRWIATLLVLVGTFWLTTSPLRAVDPVAPADDTERAPLIRGDLSDPVAASSGTVTDSSPTVDDFVPLLEPVSTPRVVESHPGNLSHGRLRVGNLYENSSDGSHFLITRVDSSGSVERLHASRWSLLWSGDVSYRDSSGFSGTTDFRKPRMHLGQTLLTRPFEEGFVRLGRVLPVELPGLGFVDGAQLQPGAAGPFRFGGALGLRPDRRDLNFSGREPVAAGYVSLEGGAVGHLYYSGTVGLLETLFGGKSDELALLYDQRSDFGPKLSLFGTTQVNFDVGGAAGRPGARLTRLNAYAVAPVAPRLTLRAGVDKYERPDTRAERDLYGAAAQIPINVSYRRYWVGGDQAMAWDTKLSEEVGWVDTSDDFRQTLWRATLGRRGLPFLPQGIMTMSVYNITSSLGEGQGGILSATLPLLGGRLMTDLAAGARYSGRPIEKKTFQLSDLSARALWRVTPHWDAQLGLSEAFQDSFQSTLVNTSLAYRW